MKDNTARLTEGEVNTLYGGYSLKGTVEGNKAVMTGGKAVKVTGGQTTEGTVSKNSVQVAGGEVSGDIRGGYSSSGTVTENKASVSNVTVSNIYGGTSAQSAAEKNKAIVASGAAVTGGIWGGKGKTAEGNEVYIYKGSEVYGGIRGGETTSGKVSGNTVTITGGTISADLYYDYIESAVYGGKSASGEVSGNKVAISGTSLTDAVVRDVYGGYSAKGDASSNTIDVSKAGMVGRRTVVIHGGTEEQTTTGGNLIGGYSETGHADNNRVTFSGLGAVRISGGKTGSGTASNNTIDLSSGGYGDSISGGGIFEDVVGGESTSGAVAGNKVNVSGTIVSGGVYGGTSRTGTVKGNSVTVSSAGKVYGGIYGGTSSGGLAEKNTVTLTGGMDHWMQKGHIAGGEGAVADGNTVIVSSLNTTIDGNESVLIYGGNASSGAAMGNIVKILNNTNINGAIKGGYSKSGSATGNSITMDTGTFNGVVYGGEATKDATANTVNINGGTFSNHIKGGISATGKAEDNKVIVSGDPLFEGGEDNSIVGGEAGTGIAKGNTVEVINAVVGEATGSFEGNGIYGGISRYGKTTGNTVAVSGSTIHKSLYGGYSEKGDSNSNTVSVLNGKIDGQEINGGVALKGRAYNNTVTISERATVMGNITGGFGNIAENNSVMVSGESTVVGNIIAGAGNTAKNNSVTVSGESTVGGDVSGNDVQVSGGSRVGSVSGDTVTVSEKSSIDGGITGGTGQGSTVTVSGGSSVNGSVTGGSSVGNVATNAEKNIVTISDAEVAGDVIGGYFLSGSSGYVANNTVMISGGIIKANVYGGYVSSSAYGIDNSNCIDSAENNTVTISGAEIAGNVTGGSAAHFGNAENNTVTISGAEIAGNVTGGSAVQYGDAKNNAVSISDSQISGSVYGGLTYRVNGYVNRNNVVRLENAVISESVYAAANYFTAYSTTSAIYGQNNTIEAKGINKVGGLLGYDTLGLTVGQDNIGDSSKAVITVTGSNGLSLAGRTVTITDPDRISYAGTNNRVSLLATPNGTIGLSGAVVKRTWADTNYTLPNGSNIKELYLKNDELLANADVPGTQSTNTLSATPKLMLARLAAPSVTAAEADTESTGPSSTAGGTDETQPLTTASKPMLMQAKLAAPETAAEAADETESDTDTASSSAGTAATPMLLMAAAPGNIEETAGAPVTGTTQEIAITGTKTASENTKTLSESLLGTVALVNQGTEFIADQGMRAIDEASASSTSVFGAMHGGSSRYETGSHIDLDSVSLMAGAAAKPAANTTLAGFIEAGWGNSKSHVSGAKGSGEHEYYGVGIAGKYNFDNPFYVDGSIRLGVAKTDFDGRYSGDKAHYKNESFYTAAHIGGGYVFNIADKTDLDLYGRYAVTWLDGDDVRLHDKENTKFHMGSSTTHALRGGLRFTGEVTDTLKWKAGLAYEHIFNGDAKGSINNLSLDTPSLQGNTAIGELGITMKPSANSPWTFDLTAKGYAGDRRGGAGSISAKYAF